jgi:hypothetical protein
MADIWGANDREVNTPDLPAASNSSNTPDVNPNWGANDTGVTIPLAAPPQTSSPDTLTAAAPYNATDAALHGMTLGLSDAGRAALMAGGRYMRGQTPGFDYSDAAKEVNAGREAYSNEYPWRNAGANLAGGATSAGPLAAKAVMGAAGPLGQIVRSGLISAGMGGVQGAADNNTSLQSAAKGAEKGAAIGGAIGTGIPIATSALAPQLTANAQLLRSYGIQPPMGTAVGGIPAVAENMLAQVPALGAPIQMGRGLARTQAQDALDTMQTNFHRGAINQALGNIGESLNPATPLGNQANQELGDKISNAYNKLVPAAGAPIDSQLQQDLGGSIANAKLMLPAEQAQRLENYINTKIITPAAQNGVLPGQGFKDAESDLGRMMTAAKQGNSSERTLGDFYSDVRGSLRDWLARSNPAIAPQIQATNQAYREALPIIDAGAASPSGDVTPQALLNASRKFGGRKQYSFGTSPMHDFGQAGLDEQKQLKDAIAKLPQPAGYAGHGGGYGVGALSAVAAEHLMEHPSLGAVAGIAGAYPALQSLYSNTGRGMANGLLALPRPAPLAPAISGLLTPPLANQ